METSVAATAGSDEDSGENLVTRRLSGNAVEAWPDAVRPRPSRLGRYELGEVLGQGGMGVVYRARDPELDRPVALKVLRGDRGRVDERSRGVARLIREAQAMAQLSHPNVISVFDVGTFDDQGVLPGQHSHEAFVAMELVEGVTLREWLEAEPRPWSEVLRICILAGRGLAAAHRAGLVHRDFKPSNVLISTAPQRVLVMDFGLARAPDSAHSTGTTRPTTELSAFDDRLTQTGHVMGTPAYMAPELFERQPSDARTDQFAFCATLFEGLYGHRPFRGKSFVELRRAIATGELSEPDDPRGVPGWLRRTVLRGLATQPDARWRSMDALLSRLEHPPRTGRWVAGLSLGTGVFLAQGLVGREPEQCCETELGATWDDARRDALREALTSSGASFAAQTQGLVIDRIDAWADAWHGAKQRSCDEQRGDTFAQRSSCLQRGAAEVEALVEQMLGDPAAAMEHARTAVDDLPDPAACLTASGAKAPPEAAAVESELAHAAALQRTGKYAEALEIAQPALERARELGFEPTLARALARVGARRDYDGDFEGGAQAYAEAVWVARAAGLDAILADAATSLVLVVGVHLARFEQGHEWARHAEATLARLPELAEQRAQLLNNIGLLLDEETRYDEARAAYLRALEIREEIHGRDSLPVALVLNNLGTLDFSLGNYEASLEWSERALKIKEALLGPGHPEVAKPLNNIGIAQTRLGRSEAARATHERALAIREATLGEDHPLIASSLNNLANVIDDLPGELDHARELHERALAIRERALGPEHQKVATSASNLSAVYERLGRSEDSRRLLRRALEIDERVYGPDNPEVGHTLMNLAVLDYNLGALDEAEAGCRRAVALLEESGKKDHTARALALLARILDDEDEDEEAERLFGRAIDLFEEVLPAAHPILIDAVSDRGWLYLDMDEPDKALADLQRAQALLGQAEGVSAQVAGTVRYGLARALVDTGAPLERVLPIVEAARLDYADSPKSAAALERWAARVLDGE